MGLIKALYSVQKDFLDGPQKEETITRKVRNRLRNFFRKDGTSFLKEEIWSKLRNAALSGILRIDRMGL